MMMLEFVSISLYSDQKKNFKFLLSLIFEMLLKAINKVLIIEKEAMSFNIRSFDVLS